MTEKRIAESSFPTNQQRLKVFRGTHQTARIEVFRSTHMIEILHPIPGDLQDTLQIAKFL